MVVLGNDHAGRFCRLDRTAWVRGSRPKNLEALADDARLVRVEFLEARS